MKAFCPFTSIIKHQTANARSLGIKCVSLLHINIDDFSSAKLDKQRISRLPACCYEILRNLSCCQLKSILWVKISWLIFSMVSGVEMKSLQRSEQAHFLVLWLRRSILGALSAPMWACSNHRSLPRTTRSLSWSLRSLWPAVGKRDLWEQPLHASQTDCALKPDGQYSVISKWLLLELSFSNHWSRGTKILGKRFRANHNCVAGEKLGNSYQSKPRCWVKLGTSHQSKPCCWGKLVGTSHQSKPWLWCSNYWEFPQKFTETINFSSHL